MTFISREKNRANASEVLRSAAIFNSAFQLLSSACCVRPVNFAAALACTALGLFVGISHKA